MKNKVFLRYCVISIGLMVGWVNSVNAEITEDLCFLDSQFELYPSYASYDDFASRYPVRDGKASISFSTIHETSLLFNDLFAQEKLLKLEIEAGYLFHNHPKQWKNLSQLKNLKSFRNRSDDYAASAEQLLKAVSTLNLVELDLAGTKIKNADTLISFLPDSQIRKLSLHMSFLPPEGIQGLARVLPLTQIQELDLAYNRIMPDVAQDLFVALPRTHITRLSLFYNSLRGTGLARVLPRSQLEYLNLVENGFNDDDVIVLSRAVQKSRLKYLDLSANPFGSRGVRALTNAIPESQLERLRLCDSDSVGGHVISMTPQEKADLIQAAKVKGMRVDLDCKNRPFRLRSKL